MEHETLWMYGAPSQDAPLEWDFVEGELVRAGGYWLTTLGSTPSHTRPVWGIWHETTIVLSVGSPRLNTEMVEGIDVCVNLGSDTDVVIVNGRFTGYTDDAALLVPYNAKYSWDYTFEEYGPYAVIAPTTVIAWRSAGWAGTGGFQQTGRWRFS